MARLRDVRLLRPWGGSTDRAALCRFIGEAVPGPGDPDRSSMVVLNA